jgi:hypothetical protein
MNEIFIKEENSSLLSELVSDPLIEKEFKDPIRKQYKIKPKKEIVNYTSNETLNKVLNETAGGIPQRDDEYATMGGGVYDSSRIDDVLVRNYGVDESSSSEVVKQRKRDIGAVQTIKNARINVDDVPDHITDALTRDYSKLMKVIDKKKVDR